MRHIERLVVLALAFCFLVASGPASGATPQSPARTVTVVADERYERPPGGQYWALGRGYRDLWAIPIRVEVLDLQTEAGGLRPVRRVGGQQTLSLAMRGNDGRDYTFRLVDKDLIHVLPEFLRDSAVADIAQDQMGATVPGGEVVSPRFSGVAGVLSPAARLVVMPDDPALGEFRGDFADRLGVFLEFPQPVSESNPGFHGATEIQGSTAFWRLRQQDPSNRADSHAFLRARLLDVLLGDWDRHSGQWRWARLPGEPLLQPLPEDRDQVFSDFEGLAFDVARFHGAQLMTCRFVAGETREIRVYAHGGDDRIEVRGSRGANTKVKIIGGPGDDTLSGPLARRVAFWDDEGNNRVESAAGAARTTRFVDPNLKAENENVPWVPSRDWGRDRKVFTRQGFHPDPGLILGFGMESTSYGFRKYPWASRHTLQGGFAFTVHQPFLDYAGEFQRQATRLHFALGARHSGLDQLRFYGLGNETSTDESDSVYRISMAQTSLWHSCRSAARKAHSVSVRSSNTPIRRTLTPTPC